MVLDAIRKGFAVATKSMGLVFVLFAFNLIFNLVSIPLAVNTRGPAAAPQGAAMPQMTVPMLIFAVVYILASILIQGGTLGLVKDAIKEGKARLGSFFSYGAKYYVRLFLLGLLIIALIAVVAVILALAVAATTPLNNKALTTAVAVAAAIVGLALLALYFIPLTISPYALVCGELGVVAALKKSLEAVKKPFSRTLGLLLLLVLLVLISLGVGFVFGFLVGVINAVIPANMGQILMGVVTSAINGYLGVVMAGAFMTFYLGLTAKEKVG